QHATRHPVDAMRDLTDPGQDAPGPVRRETLQVHLGLDPRSVAAGPEDLDGPVEVDVGDLAGLDLFLAREMERPVHWLAPAPSARRTRGRVTVRTPSRERASPRSRPPHQGPRT